MHYDTAL
jgi:hypothetical protein